MESGSEKRILVTGGTGFIGYYIVTALRQNGWTVRVITRTGELPDAIQIDGVEAAQADIRNPESLDRAVEQCSSVIHLVGIIEEAPKKDITFQRIHVDGTRNIVNAAIQAGVTYFVHMSANGASKDGKTAYQTSKFEAEEIVRLAGFDRWTIFQPSLVFGKPILGSAEFATRVVDTLVKPFPVWPIPGRGAYKLQPVAVQDLAEAFVAAVGDEKYSGRTYCVGGPEAMSYLEILDTLARAIGVKPKPKIFQPLWGMRPLVSLMAPTGLLPITPAQLELLVGGNWCKSKDFEKDFGIELKPFNENTLSYLNE